ncbi:Ig-like domain-containing protein, partial [Beijerinckia sp. L45]|uniref:Ig-like domain-containing protein n=1 Tax=Beijerinckia sp. L45 TaxID=1641855 RepID=UPI001AEDA2C0
GNPAVESAHALSVDETPPTIAIGTTAGDNVVNASEAAAGFTISGTSLGADGQTATITIVDGTNAVKDTYTVPVAAGGSWTANVTAAQAQALADGTYTMKADVSDLAGNPAIEATRALTVDETPPTATVAIAAITPDTGTSANDFVTSATSLTLTGSNTPLGTGETVQASSDGGTTWTSVSQADATHWSFADPATHAASFTYQVRVVDAAGNLDLNIASQAVTIDTTPLPLPLLPLHMFTDNSPRNTTPAIAIPISFADISSGPLMAPIVSEGFGVDGDGYNFFVVHTDVDLNTEHDASVKIHVPIASLQASLGGDVVSIVARQANGDPLPDWLKFDPRTGAFVGLPPDNATASIVPEHPEDVTGALPPDPGRDVADRHRTPAPNTISVEVLVRDSKGNLAVTHFTIDLRTHATGKQGGAIDHPGLPPGRQQHTALPMGSFELAAIGAAARDAARPFEPLVARDIRHSGAISIGPAESLPAGRAGLTEQLASVGWRSMAAQRDALLASLRQR